MLDTISRRRARVSALTLVLSLLLITTIAFAATELISAKKGGEINVAPGVVFAVPPKALDEDTVITVDMLEKGKRVRFEFEPSGLVFSKSASLRMTWEAVEAADVEDLLLYAEDGSVIEPKTTGQGVAYSIDHFSIYFFRRR